jgi:gliding motility-associated protein GldL
MAGRLIDRILNVGVSAAAVPVLFGALQKILHSPNADMWLKIGLYTECAIFAAYAILYIVAPPPEAPIPVEAKVMSDSPLKSMDKMLLEADITPTNLKKLSEGFSKLGTSVSNIGEVSEVVKSTSDFGAKTKEAAIAMGSMSAAFTASANTMSSFNTASESAKGFHEQVQGLTKNLSSLNTIYELELKEANNHLKSLNNFYGKLNEASATMMASVDDAAKAKDQISALANNLGKLNSVYGNMLSAMQGR